MEIIKDIREVSAGGQEGFIVETDTQLISLLIDNGQSCCERWGYFMSEDNTRQFIGAELIDLKLTDQALNTVKFDAVEFYEGGVMFVDIITSVGVLQFVAYNSHNGYYSHEACVISRQLNATEWL